MAHSCKEIYGQEMLCRPNGTVQAIPPQRRQILIIIQPLFVRTIKSVRSTVRTSAAYPKRWPNVPPTPTHARATALLGTRVQLVWISMYPLN